MEVMGRRSDENCRIRRREFEKWFSKIQIVDKDKIKHLLLSAFSAGWSNHRDQNTWTGDFVR